MVLVYCPLGGYWYIICLLSTWRILVHYGFTVHLEDIGSYHGCLMNITPNCCDNESQLVRV